MDYVTVQGTPQDESDHRIAQLCREIEKKARLKGNTAVIMELDRIPNLLLGAANRVPDVDKDAAIASAMAAIERITLAMPARGRRSA